MTVGFNVPNAGGLIDGPRGKLHPRTIPRHRMHLLNSHHTQTVHHHPTPLKTSKTKWKFSNCAEKKMHNNSNCTSLTTPHKIVHHQHLKNQKEQRYKQHKMHNLNHIIHNISSSPISSKPTKKKGFRFRIGQMTKWRTIPRATKRRSNDSEKEMGWSRRGRVPSSCGLGTLGYGGSWRVWSASPPWPHLSERGTASPNPIRVSRLNPRFPGVREMARNEFPR